MVQKKLIRDSASGKLMRDAATSKLMVERQMEYGDDCGCFDAGKTPKYYTVTFQDIFDCGPLEEEGWPSDANRTEVLTQDNVLPCVWKKTVGGWSIYLRLIGTCWWLSIGFNEPIYGFVAAFYCTNDDCVTEGVFNNVLVACHGQYNDCGGGTMWSIGKDGTATLTPGGTP